jgi:hypothetical protein
MRTALHWPVLAGALVSAAFTPGCRRGAAPSPAVDAGIEPADAGRSRADANPPEAGLTAVDGGATFDRTVFCNAIAAESKKTASTFPKLVERAELDKMILDQFAQIRPRFGACAGTSAWALALEQLHPRK